MRLANSDDYLISAEQLDLLERYVGNLVFMAGSMGISAGMDIKDAWALLKKIRLEGQRGVQ